MKRRVVVRQAERTDIEALAQLSNKLAVKEGLPSSGGLRNFAINGISGNGTITVVRTDNSEVVGMVIVSRHKQPLLQDCAVIMGFVLESAHCLAGAETGFLSQALSVCAKKGIRHMRKCIIGADSQAISLFHWCGFAKEKEVVINRPGSISPVKLIVLHKDI